MSIKNAVIQVEVKCDTSNQKGVPNDGLATIIGPHIQSIDKLIELLQQQTEHIVSVKANWKENVGNFNPRDVLEYVDSQGGYDQLKAMVNASDLINKRSMEKSSENTSSSPQDE